MTATAAPPRPGTYRFENGEKAPLPFAPEEYEARLAGLRALMAEADVEACLFTSMHNIAYYSGFLFCSFGRSYGLVVTADASVTISAGIDAGQPWRRCHGDNLVYTDWQRGNFWRAVRQVAGTGRRMGYEAVVHAPEADLDAFAAPDRRMAGFRVERCAPQTRFVVVATQGAGDSAALRAALESDALYVAFVGSRLKAAALRAELAAAGLPHSASERLHAPAGLDIGAITPEEIAVSILAEITVLRRRGQREA